MKKSLSIMLFLCILLTVFVAPIAPAKATIIWTNQTQLHFDPTVVEEYWEPYEKKYVNVTFTIPDFDGVPSLAGVRNGTQLTVWCVWESDGTGYNNIFYEVYDGVWKNETLTQLTFGNNDETAPSITQSTDGKIWVVWSSNRTGNYNLFYKTSSNAGRTWSAEIQLTSYGSDDKAPAVMQASDGKIWFVWSRKMNATNDDIFYKTFDGSNWSSEIRLTTYIGFGDYPGFDRQPAIMQANDGKIWIFWTRFMSSGDWDILVKTFNGTSWTNERNLTGDPGNHDTDPTAFQAQDNTMYLFWSSRDLSPNAQDDIYYKTSSDNGTTWSASFQFTKNNYDDLWPSAIQSQDRMVWVVWASSINDNLDIYYQASFLGDINNDGSIDILDLTMIARALGTDPTWPHGTGWDQWNPLCDLNADNRVNGYDLAIAGKNYGQHT